MNDPLSTVPAAPTEALRTPQPSPVLLRLFRLCLQTPQGQVLLRAATRFHQGASAA